MPDLHDVRRIVLTLAGAEAAADLQAFSVPHKGKLRSIAWVWRERVQPKKTTANLRTVEPVDNCAPPLQMGAGAGG